MEAIIEIPANEHYKYEIKNNELRIDRVSHLYFPENYGFIPGVLAPDGDDLDVFVISYREIYPTTRVKIEQIGLFKCIDNGVQDDKVVAILVGENYNKDLLEERISTLKEFLETYKEGFQVLSYEKEILSHCAEYSKEV